MSTADRPRFMAPAPPLQDFNKFQHRRSARPRSRAERRATRAPPHGPQHAWLGDSRFQRARAVPRHARYRPDGLKGAIGLRVEQYKNIVKQEIQGYRIWG